MKIVVPWKPDKAELLLSDQEEKDFIVDNETWLYFFEKIFWNGIKSFLEKKFNTKFSNNSPWITQIKKPKYGISKLLKEREIVREISKAYEENPMAKKVANYYDNQRLISKYRKEYDKIRHKFYLYNHAIYSSIFVGFINVGNEIQLHKYEMKDIVKILNYVKNIKNI